MTDHDDPLAADPLAKVITQLKEPVRLSPDFTQRVMASITEHPDRAPAPRPTPWWQRQWTIRIGPLGGLAAAASLIAVVVASQRLGRPIAAAPTVAAADLANSRLTQFVLVAPEAGEVTVVGDFNDWNVSATPLVRANGAGVWWVTVPLSPGRYRYAFMVDGAIWRQDPEAPAVEDEFGRPNSVVTIGGA